MAAVTQPIAEKLLTYKEYIENFELYPPTEQPYEILDGVVNMVQSPNWRHQGIVLNLGSLFQIYARTLNKGRPGIAPFDVVIRRTPKLRTRQPDVFFISHERLKENTEVFTSGPLLVAPELVVEILSTSETPRSLREKLE